MEEFGLKGGTFEFFPGFDFQDWASRFLEIRNHCIYIAYVKTDGVQG